MGNRIKELRKRHHMSQIHLSIELEVSQETVSAYENEKYYPSYQVLLKLSNIFNTSVDYIMGLTEEVNVNAGISYQEGILLGSYRRLNEIQKEKAIAYIQGLSDV